MRFLNYYVLKQHSSSGLIVILFQIISLFLTILVLLQASKKKKTKNSYTCQASELFQKHINFIDATKSLVTSIREQNSADAFGQSVSSQLKELPNNERWLAEKLIGEVLYYAKTGELNKNTTINLFTIH